MSTSVTKWCETCKKDVKAIKKPLGVMLCPSCSKILASDYSMDKVGR